MIASFVIIALLGYYFLDSAAKLLNLRSLRTEVPPEFQDVYDIGRYRRSHEYTRLNTWFELIFSTVELGALLAFWALDGFEAVDRFVRTFGFQPVITGLLYFGILVAGETALALPFKVYQTFVIEQRYGFNRTTVRTFIADRLKQWLISGIVMGLLASIILSLFEAYGPSAWLIAWTCTAAVSVILVYIAPTVVLPLFFKTSPVPEGPLRDQITQFATRERFPIRELLVIDGSRRSSKANAFFTGFGSNKRIALYDTLIKSHSVPELLAVLAHEIGHYKKHHIVRHFAFGQLSLLLLMLGGSLCILRPELFSAFGVSTPSLYVGLVLYLVAIRPLTAIFDILANYLSRRDEFEADRFAAQALGDPDPLILALKRLSKDSLSNLTPHPLLVSLHFTHPPIVERVLALRKWSEAVPRPV
ncbi:MAG TPA: M48 family metallopeptidase [Chthoniobacterales bacterium]|jgi:STE24 endopeptidase|nr:M48 family metallopeptidase [Chthoniobacterales bacterium]